MASKNSKVPNPAGIDLPSIPEAQNVQISPFEMPFQPVNTNQFMEFNQDQFDQQIRQQADLWNLEMSYMKPMAGSMYDVHQQYDPLYAQLGFDIQAQYAPQYSQLRLDIEKEYGPQFADYYMQQLQRANPMFMPTYMNLGNEINQNLMYGYELGPALEHEMEQNIRSAQTARGNWLGAAPTAQEAFGMGSASLDLYNTRMAQAQGFVNSKQPTDMWGQLSMANGYMPAPAVSAPMMYPQSNWMNSNVAPNVFGTVAQSESSYNSTAANAYGSYTQGLIGAANVNNESAFDRYNAQFDQFLYQQSAAAGLYSMPSMGGGMGGMGGMSSMMGPMMGGLSTGMMGLATSGVIGAGATAAGVGVAGAAAGAAAAICWLSRKLIPDKWKSFRKYLFTKATDDERRDYIYNARRLANAIS